MSLIPLILGKNIREVWHCVLKAKSHRIVGTSGICLGKKCQFTFTSTGFPLQISAKLKQYYRDWDVGHNYETTAFPLSDDVWVIPRGMAADVLKGWYLCLRGFYFFKCNTRHGFWKPLLLHFCSEVLIKTNCIPPLFLIYYCCDFFGIS